MALNAPPLTSPPSPPPGYSRSTRRFLMGSAGICLVAALVCLPQDLYVSRWIATHQLPGDIRKMIAYSEVFGHGLGVLWIVITAATLDRRGMSVAVFLLYSAFVPGLAAGGLKLLFGRLRPYACLASAANPWDTFQGPLAPLSDDPHVGLLDDRFASMPSAHAATALGLAIGLTILYPRGRWLFVTFALLVGAQRLCSQAHFLSDVMVGFALACLLTPWFPIPRCVRAQAGPDDASSVAQSRDHEGNRPLARAGLGLSP